jgi:NAD(P) transhydrogenase subunit alpha
LIIGVPREVLSDESRVGLVPETLDRLKKAQVEILVESGAGDASLSSDAAYLDAGARIAGSAEEVYSKADLIVKVRELAHHPELDTHESELIKEGGALASFFFPAEPVVVQSLRERRVSVFAMELMPRITRAQSMDVLSSMSSIAGYKAVLKAADCLPRYFPMLMTAAGTITAARVLILGAGVAGLQAIATARRLGAIVEAFDIRPVVKEQVESLGARFVELEVEAESAQDKGGYAKEQTAETQDRIRQLLHDHIRKSDVVITTALIPGKKAPVLVSAEMVRDMRPGSVVVDLAAAQGGNCELTRSGETVVDKGVRIVGPANLPGDMAFQSSQLYSRNLTAFLLHLLDDKGELHVDLEDELTRAPLVTHAGDVLHEPTAASLGDAGAAAQPELEPEPAQNSEPEPQGGEAS